MFAFDNMEETAELLVELNATSDYCHKIRAYRKEHNLTQEELAKQLEVNFSTLRSWEQGKTKPPYHVWRKYKYLFDNAVDFP